MPKNVDKLNERFKHVKVTDNEMFHYDSGLNQFTQAEVDKLNEEY